MIVIVSDRPNCKTCKNPMPSWNPWADEHECVECTVERIVENCVGVIDKDLIFETLAEDELKKYEDTKAEYT